MPACESNATPRSGPTTLNPEAQPYNPTSTRALWTYSGKHVLLQTAQTTAFNPDNTSQKCKVRIVMDTGSQRSYVTDKVREQLTLTSAGEQCMTIMTFGATQGGKQVCKYVKLGLELKNGQGQILTLFSVPTICEPLAPYPVVDCGEKYPHLSGLQLADESEDVQDLGVDILIGADYYWDFITGKIQRGLDGPVAIDTKFGWVVSGPISVSGQTNESYSLMTHALRVDTQPSETLTLDETMKSFWELESFGIPSKDQSLYDELCDTIEFREGRYEVQLPWKTPRRDLPNNYALSLKRLKGLIRRLKNSPDVLHEYDTVIKTQLQQGIVELVEDSSEPDIPEVHYLPHHAVIRQNKTTTKLCVVYDASAKTNGPSLNECLNPGPKFNQRILDILNRFRVHKIAVIADVEKAFLMISVASRDREFLRFLWMDDPTKEDPKILIYRFARVVFGLTSSPFLLNATIRQHLEKYSESQNDLVLKILRSIYVDDLVSGSQTETQAHELYTDAKKLLKIGGFNLRKFSTNSATLQAKVDSEESTHSGDSSQSTKFAETFSEATLGGSQRLQDDEQKVLGVNWNVSSDQFVFSLNELAEQAKRLEPTKRNVISLIGKFYDPLGFLAPIVVRYKIYMQALCEAKIAWDEIIPEPLMAQWKKLVLALLESQPISLPRCYIDGVCSEIYSYQLCGYCDASLSAYAAVIYLLIESEDGSHMRFLVAKTRVAPLKKQSIPRLELLAAVLLARLMDTMKASLVSELEISSCHCFTDSQVALCWISNVEKSWKPFVQNRVSEIRRLLPVECWKHIPGLNNPADIPSRGVTPLELLVSKLWREGPEVPLGHSITDGAEFPSECLGELRASERHDVCSLLTNEISGHNLRNLVDIQKFSSFSRLINVLTYVVKFCSILRRKTGPTEYDGNERKYAESLLIKEVQISLKSHKNFPMWKRQFSLFADDTGILRCQGRIGNASNLSYSTKHPVILPGNHHLTTLYVRRAHARVLHDGVKETLAELRSQFWVIKGRSVVKKILHNCNICRRHEGRSCRIPPPPPLPSFRVQEAPPFTSTGVDFAGPLYVKSSGASQSKVWIVLYTCCVTRAIHLDLVPDLSTHTFIRSFKRFSSRRGLPALMISDNGKTFKAAAKVIKSVVFSPEVQKYFDGAGIEWKFNVPRAPWWGGIFERLVRSTKRCLRKALGQAKFSYDELLTVLVEIEMVLNSRPLTYIAADDLDEPLTPSHLLMGRRLMSFPDHLIIAEDDTENNEEDCKLNTRLKHLNHSLNSFWKRWRREYLVELREAHRHYRSSGEPQLSEGDVVVIYTENQPRSFWKLGRIERMIIGADGQKRAATVRVSKNGRVSTLDRPLQHLYPLEVAPHTETMQEQNIDEVQEQNVDEVTDPEPVLEQDVQSSRPRRSAAARARDSILAQALSENQETL